MYIFLRSCTLKPNSVLLFYCYWFPPDKPMAESNSAIIIMFTFFFIGIMTTYSIPFAVFHGISEQCKGKEVERFTQLLSNWSGSKGYCIEIGNGALDSWFTSLPKQVEFLCNGALDSWIPLIHHCPCNTVTIACEKVKKMSELNQGYNIVGLSQGNIIARGVIEFCDGPPVKNLISLAGPHAGIASMPLCGSGVLCILADYFLDLFIYSNFVQEHLAPAGYIKIPTDMENYKKHCKFLPKVNNEFHRNVAYKKKFTSLQNLVLIMFEEDEVLVPRETSLFGYFSDGSYSTILPAQETMLYKEDWIGLRSLDEDGKVRYVNVSGHHLEISFLDMRNHILPYLIDSEFPSPQSSPLLQKHLFCNNRYWIYDTKTSPRP